MKAKNIFFLAFFAIVTTAIGISAYSFKAHVEPVMLTFPKGSTYEKEWSKVDSLIGLGLTKSGLETVEAIYKKAKTDNNAPQIVKAIMHRLRLEQQMQENEVFMSINKLNDEIKSSSYPVTPVLHSMLADIYQQYYNNNRWKFSQRTQVVNIKMEDISTWDLKTLFDQIIKHHLEALKSADSLKRTSLNIYDDIVYNGTSDARKLRPTLFDFIAHRAIDFLMNDEPDVIRPAYKFELTGESYFDEYGKFIKSDINNKDTLSTKYYATRILQDLLSFHSGDNDPAALIDADLKRLHFVRRHAVTGINDSLYLKALGVLEQKFIKHASSAEVSYAIAQLYNERAGKYDPRRSEENAQEGINKWFNKKAVAVCKEVNARFPGSFGAEQCLALESSIRLKNMAFTLEKVNLVNKPFRGYLSYKNLTKVYARAVPVEFEKYLRKYNNYDGYDAKQMMQEYLKLKPAKEWEISLPDDGDFQTHYLEFKIPELGAGYYLVMISDKPSFEVTGNGIAYDFTWISNLSFVNRRLPNGGYEFYVMDRETGNPLKGVTGNLWYSEYNYRTRKYDFIKSDSYVTNDQGYFAASPGKEYANFDVELINGKDRYRTENSLYMYRQTPYERKMEPRTILFTDRAIYRPGQTIYFKGIMINTDGRRNEILPNNFATVTFYDVNYQKISSLDLTTNEYGSYSGTFTAPNSVLNGNMTIGDGYGTVNISVEDYKRPKFEVNFSPVKGVYRLNDEIKAAGTAKAYAGSNIDGAEVKYRVVRNASFPYWWWCWRGYYPSSPQMEITNGVVTTNDTGGFVINFKAIADMSIPRSSSPTYAYTVYADVTDINGETRSSQTVVSVAYNALNLSVNIPTQINKDTEKKFEISTSNTNGVFEAGQGKIEIYKVKEPDRIFRNRLWEKPDRFIMTKEEYYTAFPKDVYADESNMFTWERGEKIVENNFDTEKSKELLISDLGNWKPGVYVMEAHTKDKFGEDAKDLKYFTVYSEKGTSLPTNNTDWFTLVKGGGEPGEKAVFILGTKENDVKVMYDIEEQGKSVKREWLTLSNEQKRIEIPIEEKHRGNFSIHLVFVKNGREYEHDATISVPWTNKELDIEFETFRNKLLPGQKEEWKVKIKDKKGDKMMAEMMATMYDASLDVFRANNWYLNIYGNDYSTLNWENQLAFGANNSVLYADGWNDYHYGPSRSYEQLNWFGYYFYYYYGYYGHRNREMDGAAYEEYDDSGLERSKSAMSKPMKDMEGDKKVEAPSPVTTAAASEVMMEAEAKSGASVAQPGGGQAKAKGDLSGVAARTNFNETAFFYPHLQTDEQGSVIIKFTIPEALTRWKMMGLAHTKDLKYGQITKELVTQKDLMIVPNAPRFFRENDKMEFTAKISNLSDKELSGEAQLFLFDAITMKPLQETVDRNYISAGGSIAIDNKGNRLPENIIVLKSPAVQSFTSKKGQSASVTWTIQIPEGVGAITYKVVGKAGNFTDGEEMAVPVLTNSMLVTESLPLPIRSKQTKAFKFEKLIGQNGGSTTLRNHKLTLEFTSNPAWYAVQALPYLMEYPYECAEQTFSRFYANSIATHIANSSPKIKVVFESWKSQTPDALLSNLEKNQELKALMLEETPWVYEAKDETERKKRVALLFDLNRMSNELDRALTKLEKMQVSNGGWPWFEGMPDDRYITQHIITGMGHLDHLGIKNVREDNKVWRMVKRGARYLDERIREDYEWILKHGHPELDNISYERIQYLYARSYFKDIPVESRNQKAFDYFKGQAQQYWLNKGRYMQGMIALALKRYDDKVIPGRIIKSLKENALNNDEMGMYWKENYEGFYWWEAPIEAQALMIEAFDEVANDKKSVDDLKVWLLKSKQTQNWKTTKATTEACYALLLQGTDWLTTESNVEISLGNVNVDPKNLPGVKQEAGTGYFKTSWSGSDIKPAMGNVTVVKKDEGVSWGSLYWQYFEQLDKITSSKTPLQLVKKLFVERNTPSGPVIEPIEGKVTLKVGDKLKVRIELRVDRDMQYVHMKDMRASGFEPMNVISRYKWQDGLGYYESTRDAATNFFISYLPKGTYVFEYPLRVTHNGDFSNGITSIQCMYAPEFTSNSEGIRVKVGK